MWAPLIIFIVLMLFVVCAIELRERHRAKQPPQTPSLDKTSTKQLGKQVPADCCGTHLVCERDTLLNTTPDIVYYDDEELDVLADKNPDEYGENEILLLKEVFYSLQDTDVAGWCRSLQLRHIELPSDLRDEALLIVREQRQQSR